jgi:hypothetical protein
MPGSKKSDTNLLATKRSRIGGIGNLGKNTAKGRNSTRSTLHVKCIVYSCVLSCPSLSEIVTYISLISLRPSLLGEPVWA